jgi:hypothetical protein
MMADSENRSQRPSTHAVNPLIVERDADHPIMVGGVHILLIGGVANSLPAFTV